MKVAVLTTVLCLLAAPATAQRVLKSEPPVGALKERQRVLVDDGTCPAGQIKEVLGGDTVRRVARSYRCIPWKK